MYSNSPELYLPRKKEIFDQWESMRRRHYIKVDYPSKIGMNAKESKQVDNLPQRCFL